MGAIGDVLKHVSGPASVKEPKDPKKVRKYVQFTGEEWIAMETSAEQKLEPNDVKAIVQGIFAGKVKLTPVKA